MIYLVFVFLVPFIYHNTLACNKMYYFEIKIGVNIILITWWVLIKKTSYLLGQSEHFLHLRFQILNFHWSLKMQFIVNKLVFIHPYFSFKFDLYVRPKLL